MSLHMNNLVERVGFWEVYKLNVSWDNITCKLIHNKCDYNSCHIDIKYPLTLNTKSSIAISVS